VKNEKKSRDEKKRKIPTYWAYDEVGFLV